ncbi:MAG: DUF1353 domain-containing protein [Hoeflea sp.]|uniref:DUF1353 domain-containing protein n=1 Tax=Hoeflea sp. TaxID=1940281 RepID=UPI003EFA1EAA
MLKSSLLAIGLLIATPASADWFEGKLTLTPPGCQKLPGYACKLAEKIKYHSSETGLTWQADKWQDGNGQSGTTDGASIPVWAQKIIGNPYDESYLKAAIIHDHYCYEENHVRSWRQTHRMFYTALTHLGLPKAKAKVMYYAVYLAGPKWVEIVAGEDCGENCVKDTPHSGIRFDIDRFDDQELQAQISAMNKRFSDGDELSLEELEAAAESADYDDFFYKNGDTYESNGPGDVEVLPRS